MAKCIRDGLVAVLYSPGPGAGWSTWNTDLPEHIKFLLHDEKLVELVEQRRYSEIRGYVESIDPDIYTGGARQLTIEWVKAGALFVITERNGSEEISFPNQQDIHIA